MSTVLSLSALKNTLFFSLKYSSYLYVICGFFLVLFTLHWQSKLPLDMSEKVQIKKIELNNSQRNMASTDQDELISLSANFSLSTYTVAGNKWLALIRNSQIDTIFSSKETAAILTIKRIYNSALIILTSTLVLFLMRARGNEHNKSGIKISVIISLIFSSQQLFSWSFMFNGIILGQHGLSVTNALWLYMIISLVIIALLRQIIEYEVTQNKSAYKALFSGGEKKVESLIAYASQSGTAASIAKNIAKHLPNTSGYHIACVSSLRAEQLSEYQQVFLLASTYGDGEPPEQAISFVSSLQKLEQPLNKLKYAVLALGDKEYPKFCAFGHQLAATLQQKGAQALLPVAEINQGHEGSIQLWWQQLTQLLGWHSSAIEKSWQTQRTLSNHCLNLQSPERPAHHIRLSAENSPFSPGDLVEILPEIDEVDLVSKINQQGWLPSTMVTIEKQSLSFLNALKQRVWLQEEANNPQELIDKLPKLTARTYSIASCPEQQSIDLLVRKVIKDDNSTGLCSGYLSELTANQAVKIAIKAHQSFHPPSSETPLIMVAAGTGLAPFIGFLEQRQRASNSGKSWLIMGERDEDNDSYFTDRLNEFQQSGCLHKRQHAWSQGDFTSHKKYVGDIIASQQDEIRHWLLELNAQLYICGNIATLGASCDAVLSDILGKETLESLIKDKKIKYDLY